MAQHRTKKQKVAQTLKRQQTVEYSLADVIKGGEHLSKSKPAALSVTSNDMFGYPTRFIAQDILKTLVVASVVLAVLAVIVWWELH
jgi:hypothetical protein